MKKKLLNKIKKGKKRILIFVAAFIFFIMAIFFYNNFFRLSMYVGDSFFGRKFYNLDVAERAFLLASRSNPPYPYSNYQLGRINFIKGNFYTALDYFDKEEKDYPDHSKVNYMRGLTFGYLGNESMGILEFKKFIEKNPKTWAGRNDLAWLQFRLGDIKGAIETIKPAVDNTPNNPWVLNSYGTYLLNDGKYKEALENFYKAKNRVSKMTENEWGIAYPGNDPRVYNEGRSQMLSSIDSNILLTEQKIKEKVKSVDNR